MNEVASMNEVDINTYRFWNETKRLEGKVKQDKRSDLERNAPI